MAASVGIQTETIGASSLGLMQDVGESGEQRRKKFLEELSQPIGASALSGNTKTAEADDPAQLQIRLNQMLYDKRLSRQRGEDVEGDEYSHYNTQIRMLRTRIKGMSE